MVAIFSISCDFSIDNKDNSINLAMRAAMQLRPMLSELGTLSVSNIFGIPKVQNSFDEEGNPTDDHMVSGAKKLLDQLDWYAVAMKNHRDTVGVPQ